MIQKNFDEITKADIDFLIDNKIGESKTLEYKETLPGTRDSDKKEFLADISSFANASGGDVIYGIKAAVDQNGKKTGDPESVVCLHGVTADEAKLRIENLIRTGIESRMNIHVKEISGYGNDGDSFVILVRIPQSFASPHMVTFKNASRFYCRNSAGKYQLDVQEIRDAFLATDSQAERIRDFLRNRLAKIMADETPVPLSTPHRLVLHVIPLSSFLNHQKLQLSSDHNLTLDFTPIGAGGWCHRYNLDGFLTYNRNAKDATVNDSYCQLFFDRSIESVYADIVRERDGTLFIGSIKYERYIIDAMEKYFRGYKTLEVDAPLIVTMALLGCKGAYLFVSANYGGTWQPIDRDVAILPEVRAKTLDEEVPTFMRPIFDAVWNACGHPHSYNYDENGLWKPR